MFSLLVHFSCVFGLVAVNPPGGLLDRAPRTAGHAHAERPRTESKETALTLFDGGDDRLGTRQSQRIETLLHRFIERLAFIHRTSHDRTPAGRAPIAPIGPPDRGSSCAPGAQHPVRVEVMLRGAPRAQREAAPQGAHRSQRAGKPTGDHAHPRCGVGPEDRAAREAYRDDGALYFGATSVRHAEGHASRDRTGSRSGPARRAPQGSRAVPERVTSRPPSLHRCARPHRCPRASPATAGARCTGS